MLHLLHLALAPIFILRKKIILPLALGGAVFLIHFRFERSRVSLITALAVVAIAASTAIASAACIHCLHKKWALRKDVVQHAWLPQTGQIQPRCIFSGEPVTHRCPRCKALVHEGCLLEELKGPWAMIVKEAAPQMFLRAVDPSIPGMQGRMLIDEAFSCVVDWMQCKASMCCLGCVLDLRCCQVMPSLVLAIACIAMAASWGSLALREFSGQVGWSVLPSLCTGCALYLSCAQPMLLFHAYATVVAFSNLHRSVEWKANVVREPTMLERWFAGPSYLTDIPCVDDDEDM